MLDSISVAKPLLPTFARSVGASFSPQMTHSWSSSIITVFETWTCLRGKVMIRNSPVRLFGPFDHGRYYVCIEKSSSSDGRLSSLDILQQNHLNACFNKQ